MSLDLEKQLTFVSTVSSLPEDAEPHPKPCANPNVLPSRFQYGAYHHNSVNVFIHIVCVPLILFSAFEIVWTRNLLDCTQAV